MSILDVTVYVPPFDNGRGEPGESSGQGQCG